MCEKGAVNQMATLGTSKFNVLLEINKIELAQKTIAKGRKTIKFNNFNETFL